jgi:hypothetical protein
MGVDDTEKNGGTQKRLSLSNSKAVRAALCKLARLYHNGQIPDSKIRNLTYVLNSILGADKFINVESDLNNKFEQLERIVNGQGGTVIDTKDLDSPYAKNLKRQLEGEQRINTDLQNDILALKRQLAGIQPAPTDLECVEGS